MLNGKWYRGFVCVAAAGLLQACALPSGSPGLKPVENIAGCQVWGSWSTYTWTGRCENGKPTGTGVLTGYSRSTKMAEYTGEMQNGVRHGKGTLWVNHDAYFGGPQTTTGRFENGKHVEGTYSYDNVVHTIGDGTTVASNYTSPTRSESTDGMGSVLIGALGMVAQAAAAGQFQSGAVGKQPASQGAASTSGFKSGRPATGCLTFTRSSKHNMRVENRCAFDVKTVYCFASTATSAAILASSFPKCGVEVKGENVSAQSHVQIYAPSENTAVGYVACQQGRHELARITNVNWDGRNLQAQCGIVEQPAYNPGYGSGVR